LVGKKMMLQSMQCSYPEVGTHYFDHKSEAEADAVVVAVVSVVVDTLPSEVEGVEDVV
jgi:hypothetical protein